MFDDPTAEATAALRKLADELEAGEAYLLDLDLKRGATNIDATTLIDNGERKLTLVWQKQEV